MQITQHNIQHCRCTDLLNYMSPTTCHNHTAALLTSYVVSLSVSCIHTAFDMHDVVSLSVSCIHTAFDMHDVVSLSVSSIHTAFDMHVVSLSVSSIHTAFDMHVVSLSFTLSFCTDVYNIKLGRKMTLFQLCIASI